MNIGLGLINNRALARYMIEKRKIDGSIDAVMSTLRRYKIGDFEKIFDKALEVIGKSTTLSTKTSLASISIVKDAEVQELLSQLFSLINYNQGDTLRIIQANGSIKILTDEKNIEKIKSLFLEDKIINIQRNLAEINIHMHPEAEKTPGVMAVTANELAINGINILEAMSSFTEVIWFLDEKDVLKAYDTLNRLRQLKTKPVKKKIEQAT